MLVLTLALMTLAQPPQEMKPWVDQDGDPNRPNSYVVSGMPELSPKEAWVSATNRAREVRQDRLQAIGQRVIERRAPMWLPEFVTGRVLKTWSAERTRRSAFEELDRNLVVRDHDFAKSYQAFLLLAEPGDAPDRAAASLERRLERAANTFVRRCGASLLWWGIVAFAAFWIDRLTRGYMTVRLTLLAIGAGIAGPVVLMLL